MRFDDMATAVENAFYEVTHDEPAWRIIAIHAGTLEALDGQLRHWTIPFYITISGGVHFLPTATWQETDE